jgi:hypothetical protein
VNWPSLLELCGFQRFGHAYFDLLLPSLLHASACPIVSRPWAQKVGVGGQAPERYRSRLLERDGRDRRIGSRGSLIKKEI